MRLILRCEALFARRHSELVAIGVKARHCSSTGAGINLEWHRAGLLKAD
jgi:hypothetical protein